MLTFENGFHFCEGLQLRGAAAARHVHEVRNAVSTTVVQPESDRACHRQTSAIARPWTRCKRTAAPSAHADAVQSSVRGGAVHSAPALPSPHCSTTSTDHASDPPRPCRLPVRCKTPISFQPFSDLRHVPPTVVASLFWLGFF
jgi:hypothetical protein